MKHSNYPPDHDPRIDSGEEDIDVDNIPEEDSNSFRENERDNALSFADKDEFGIETGLPDGESINDQNI